MSTGGRGGLGPGVGGQQAGGPPRWPSQALPPLPLPPRIDASENQVDETIFVLESFIESTMKKP